MRSPQRNRIEQGSNRNALRFKVRLWFSRDEIAAFYPHQAVLGAFGRAVRRAGLPVRFTEGFNPHPRIAIPYALSVGIPGDCEVLEIELHDWHKPSEVAIAVNRFLPRGMQVIRAKLVPAKRACFVLTSALYSARLPSRLLEDAAEGAKKLMELTTFICERGEKKKKIDIRSFIEELYFEGSSLFMKLRITGKGTARPREIVEAVLPPDAVDVRLVRIFKHKLEIKDAD